MFGLAFETALRSIIKTPGVSLLVMLAIALGVGVTMPMVTLYYNTSENPLPERGDQLYRVLVDNWLKDQPFWWRFPEVATEFLTAIDANGLLRSEIPTRQAVMYSGFQYVQPFGANDQVQPLFTQVKATGGAFFEMFGATFAHGGGWDEQAEAEIANVSVINKVTNDRLFGGGDNTGRQIKIAGETYTIVGILDAWELIPRVYDLTVTGGRTESVFVPVSGFARTKLRPGISITLDAQAGARDFDTAFLNSETLFAILWVQLDTDEQVAAYREFLDQHWRDQKSLGRYQKPLNNQLHSATDWLEVSPRQQNALGQYSAFIVVGVAFLAVCLFNTLSLLLSKFLAATPEVSITRALGASRALIFSQHLIEVGLLGIIGGMLGIAFARVGLWCMRWVYIENIPRELSDAVATGENADGFTTMDANLLSIALALSMGAAIVSALYPAWRACSIPPAEYLKVN